MLASTCFMKGTLIRLKKYSRPTQVIPAMKWNQRTMSCVASEPVWVGMTIAAAATKCCIGFPPPTCLPKLELRVVRAPRMSRDDWAFGEETSKAANERFHAGPRNWSPAFRRVEESLHFAVDR